MKSLISIFFLLFPCILWGQQSNRIKGSLVDTCHNPVKDASIVLMNQADSSQITWIVCKEHMFELKYKDTGKPLLLHVSAIGYAGKYIKIDPTHLDLGEIVMKPWTLNIDEVTVSVKKPIVHKVERGRDQYMIPEWMGMQAYDLSSLLALVPGLILKNDDIEIAGIGKPVYILNGLNPQMGELESLNPRDIEKVTIARMPSGKFGPTAVGIIYIETKKQWFDYMRVRLKNQFKYTNVTNNESSLSCNYKKNKLSHYVGYSFSYEPLKYDLRYGYETIIPEEDIHYNMSTSTDMYEKNKKHRFIYSTKYQINTSSFVDLQYYFSMENILANNLVYTAFFNEDQPDLSSRTLTDMKGHQHLANIRYDNMFDERKRLTFSIGCLLIDDKRDEGLKEEVQQPESTHMAYRQAYKNKVLSSSLDYTHAFGELEIETGVSYGKLWTWSKMDYDTGENTPESTSRNESATVYLNLDHAIGKFHYQIGLRGEYEYRHEENENYKKKHSFYFLPSAGMSYRVDDDLNFMLYYYRTTTQPSVKELNTNVSYMNKYVYFTGNPLLKPTVSHSFMTRWVFPYHLSLTCNYSYNKNGIFQLTVNDKDDPNILVNTYENLKKSQGLSLTLAWDRTFRFYYLNLNAGYFQSFAKVPFVDQKVKYSKPGYSFYAMNSITLYEDIKLNIIGNYTTACESVTSYSEEAYSATVQLQMLLLKKRLNVLIAGNSLLNSGAQYQESRYKHTLSIDNSNFHPRGITIGVTYNFNNYIDKEKREESEIIKRAL